MIRSLSRSTESRDLRKCSREETSLGQDRRQAQGMRSSDQSREMPRGGHSDQSSGSGDNWGNQSRKNNFGPGGSRDRFEESRNEDEFSNWRRRDDRGISL